jgi:hypothetical protein
MILTITALIFALLGAILLLRGIFQLLQHPLKASFMSSLGGCLSASGVALLAVSINIASYQRLTNEHHIATVSFYQLSPQLFTATLHLPDENITQQLDLKGDDWQLDAKILKWHGYANIIGLDALYKLDRLSGRYQDINQQETEPLTVYPLNQEPGLNIWHVIEQYPLLLPFVDAFYGNAVFLPMYNQAEYQVFITQSGLIARPANPAAKQTVKNWSS